MKLSDYVVDFFIRQNVGHVFEFIGGSITHLIDSLQSRKPQICCVSVHHEQSGAFAAEAYARVNGNLGIALATSGPGALNLLTGIGSCYFDSVPCLFITGQVNTYEYKFDKPIRQIGFQETDIISVAKPLVKYAELVVDPSLIRYHLEKAVHFARTGRPGPVLLDIPMDIQRAEIDPDSLTSFFASPEYLSETVKKCETEMDKVISMLKMARRPLILAGGGIRLAGAADEFRTFVDFSGIPVVSTLMGLDALHHEHPNYYGMIGAYGNRFSNLAVANCDLLLVLGARLDTRQTGTLPETFAQKAEIIHVDIDDAELNAKVRATLALHCDVKGFLQLLSKSLPANSMQHLSHWHSHLKKLVEEFPTDFSAGTGKRLIPNFLMKKVSQLCGQDDIICVDVGQHQMWAGQSFVIKPGQRFLTSGGMGAMGFALPAAIGAVYTGSCSKAIVLVGDGGLQVNIQELSVIAGCNLPIKIIVFNNKCLGMVRQFQDVYFDGRQQSTVIGYTCPDFIKVAEAYGIQTLQIESTEADWENFYSFLEKPGPCLVEIILDTDTVVEPKLLVNKPVEDMSPPLAPERLKTLMSVDNS